ncbi:MAG: surface-adhesin E family protein [Burkholderiales bacterium]
MMRCLWLVLILAAGQAAADWVDIPVTPGAATVAYDSGKLVIEADQITYWRRVQFRMPLPAGEALAWSALYRESIDCARSTLRTLGYLLYAQDGSVIENVYVPEADTVSIVEDTTAAAFEEKLCAIVAAKKEAEAAQAVDPHEAELRRLEEELRALEDSIRRLREEPLPEPEAASSADAGADEPAAEQADAGENGTATAVDPETMQPTDAAEIESGSDADIAGDALSDGAVTVDDPLATPSDAAQPTAGDAASGDLIETEANDDADASAAEPEADAPIVEKAAPVGADVMDPSDQPSQEQEPAPDQPEAP